MTVHRGFGLHMVALILAPSGTPLDVSLHMDATESVSVTPSLWDPTVESGLVLWVSPRDAATITTVSASVTNGDDFGNAAWTKNQTTVSTNVDGVADDVIVSAGASDPYVTQNVTNASPGPSGNVPMVMTILAKYVDVQWLCIESRATTAANQAFFDILNGTVGTLGANMASASISAADGSGYRTITVSMIANGSATATFRVHLSTANTTVTAPGTGARVTLKNAAVSQTSVSVIKNKVTNTDLTAPAAANRPGQATVLGVSYLDWFANQLLRTTEAAVLAALDNASPFTLLYVVKPTNYAANRYELYCGDSASNNLKMRVFGQVNTSGGKRRCQANNDANTTTTFDSTSAGLTTAQVNAWYTSNSGANLNLGVNGVDDATNGAASSSGALTPNRCTLGGRDDSSADGHFLGQSGEMLLYNVELASARRAIARRWLAGHNGEISVA